MALHHPPPVEEVLGRLNLLSLFLEAVLQYWIAFVAAVLGTIFIRRAKVAAPVRIHREGQIGWLDSPFLIWAFLLEWRFLAPHNSKSTYIGVFSAAATALVMIVVWRVGVTMWARWTGSAGPARFGLGLPATIAMCLIVLDFAFGTVCWIVLSQNSH